MVELHFDRYSVAPQLMRAPSGSMRSPDLNELRSIALATGDRQGRARKAAEWVRSARGYHWVGLYDVSPSQITAIAWTGPTAPAHPAFPRGQGLNGAAVEAGSPVVVQDVRKDPRYLTTFGATLAEAIFPVRSTAQGIVGTIDVESDHVNAFSTDDQAFLAQCTEALRPLWDEHAA